MSPRCEPCQREFQSQEALEMHRAAKHSLAPGLSSEERQQAKIEIQQGLRQKQRRMKRWKRSMIYGMIIVAVVLLGYWVYSVIEEGGTYSKGQVHWHADFSISICGETIPLPRPTGGSVHGQPFVGIPLLHLHDGPVIHIEGTIKNPEEITLGRFMEVIDLNFNDDELLEYHNDEVCSGGQPGRVRLLVNGKESPELARKVIVDGEEYQLRFE